MQKLQFLECDVHIAEGFRLFYSSVNVSSLCWSLCKDNFGKCLLKEIHPVPEIVCLEVNEDRPGFAVLLMPVRLCYWGPHLKRYLFLFQSLGPAYNIWNSVSFLRTSITRFWEVVIQGWCFSNQNTEKNTRTAALCFKLSVEVASAVSR